MRPHYHGILVFSPRAWRCFYALWYSGERKTVFSTCVEVFPKIEPEGHVHISFLHVRGGVSYRH